MVSGSAASSPTRIGPGGVIMEIEGKYPSVSCAICQIRKEKRFCPALHDRICAQCCGEAREVTLDCPSDCVYLQQARLHEKPRSPENLDSASFFPHIEVTSQFVYQHEHLLAGLSFAIAKSARADRSLNDQDAVFPCAFRAKP